MLCATAVMVEFLFEMLYRCDLSCTLLVLAGDMLLIECGFSQGERGTRNSDVYSVRFN